MVTRRTVIKGIAVAPLATTLAWHSRFAVAQSAAIRVGSKDFPESIIIGEMLALLLENAGLKVDRKLNLGGTEVAHTALVNNQIDLYPEYTGSGLLVILKKTVADALAAEGGSATPQAAAVASPVPGVDPVKAVYDYVKSLYESQFGLTWLTQTGVNDTQALAVTKDFATKNNLTTISQLAALSQSQDLTISAPSDFEEREDGLIGLQKTYGLKASVNGVAPGLKYQSFLDGDAQIVLAFSTDSEIAVNNLVVLQDDKALWPPYYVAPVVRQETLTANPGIADALNALAPVLTTDKMIQLNGQVVGDQKQEPAAVAKAFLQQQGLISG
jgi:osmoprotectant transport system substrate-binding protein